MFTVLAAIVLLCISVLGVYLLLRSMGRDGVEAAAPGSCRSGRCGVRPGAGGAMDVGEVRSEPMQPHARPQGRLPLPPGRDL